MYYHNYSYSYSSTRYGLANLVNIKAILNENIKLFSNKNHCFFQSMMSGIFALIGIVLVGVIAFAIYTKFFKCKYSHLKA
jgi:hypothetical protein